MLKQPTTPPLLRLSQWIYKDQCCHQPTKYQNECPCTIPDEHNQQWHVADASFHPCLDEPHGDQNEQEALKNEAGHPGNQMQCKIAIACVHGIRASVCALVHASVCALVHASMHSCIWGCVGNVKGTSI